MKMMVSEYITIDGKSYVTTENYDKVLYLLKQKEDELYRIKTEPDERDLKIEKLLKAQDNYISIITGLVKALKEK
jgi:hypothetical protein